MKKVVKITVGIVLALVVILVGFFTLVPEVERDLINPFVPKEEVYVQINEDPIDARRYEYTLIGYTEDGDKKEVTFSSTRVLKENAFLIVTTKGVYVEKWEEIQVEELPDRVKEQLNSD